MIGSKGFLLLIIPVLVAGLYTTAPAQEKTDIARIIAETAIEGAPSAMSGYSYKMEFTRVKRSIIGRSTLKRRYKALLPTYLPKSHSFQHPLLLVYDSTRKLDPVDIVGERKRIIARLEEMESSADSESPEAGSPNDGYMTLRADSNTVGEQALKIDLVRLLKSAKFSNLNRFQHRGRATVSMTFEPHPDGTYVDELFYLGQIEGTIYIDERDKRIVSVEGYTLGGLKKYGSKPEDERARYRVLYYQQIRMRDGNWFPETAELNFVEFPYKFNRLAVKIKFSFTDYKRFTTSVRSHDLNSEDLITAEPDQPVTTTDN